MMVYLYLMKEMGFLNFIESLSAGSDFNEIEPTLRFSRKFGMMSEEKINHDSVGDHFNNLLSQLLLLMLMLLFL